MAQEPLERHGLPAGKLGEEREREREREREKKERKK
ncbi:hypothetical protein HMPREF0178_03077, partial [Bilophila sp. 4_1_30]